MRLPILLFALLLTACAGSGAPRPQGGGGIDALYARLDQASQRYRAGLAQLAAGEKAEGRDTVQRASADLLEAATHCRTTPGCEIDRFFAAYDVLLAAQAQGEDNEGESFAALEGNQVDTAGEGGSPVVRHLPEAGRSINLLNGRALRDVIALNGPVKAAMSDWLTWQRPFLITAWENYQFMRYLMWPEYEQAGLPEALLFGIMAKESGGRVHAVSRAGASGPLQFMYATGLRYGLGRVDGFDTRFDPQLSSRASVLYLNDRFAELNHNLELSLAAYNGGEGRVGRLARANPGKGFWDPAIHSALPQETRDYVPAVLAAAWLFLHPEEYGLEFPQLDTAPSSVIVQRPISMNGLAICIGNAGSRDGWFRVLRNLNPRYEAHVEIPAGTELRMPAAIVPVYHEHCVDGGRAEMTATLIATRLPALQARQAAIRSHTVRAGDTLAAIARRYNCPSAQSLAQANNIRPPQYLIRPGQQIRLTGCRG